MMPSTSGALSLEVLEAPVSARAGEPFPVRLQLRSAQGDALDATGEMLEVEADDPLVSELGLQPGGAEGFSLELTLSVAGSTEIRFSVVDRPLDASWSLDVRAAEAAQEPSSLRAVRAVAEVGEDEGLRFEVLLLDAFGNPVPDTGVRLVTDVATDVLDPPEADSDADGMAYFAVTPAEPGDRLVRALVGDGLFTLAVGAQVVDALPDLDRSSLTASPTAVDLWVNDEIALSLVLRNASDEALGGLPVYFRSLDPADAILSADAETDAQGRAFASVRIAAPGQRTIEAGVEGRPERWTIVVAGLPGALSTLTFETDTTSLTADGSVSAQLVVRALDAAGNPIAGLPVTLESNREQDILAPEEGQTGADGAFEATIRSTRSGTALLQARAANQTRSLQIAFTAGPADASASSFFAGPNFTAVSASASMTLSLNIRDAQGNPVRNVPIELSSSEPDDLITPVSGLSSGTGAFFAQLQSTRAGTRTVTVSVDDARFSFARDLTFLPGPVDLDASLLIARPSIGTPGPFGQPVVVTALVRDAFDNAISFAPIEVSADGGSISPNAGVTDSDGAFEALLQSPEARTITLRLFVEGDPTRDPLEVSFLDSLSFGACGSTGADGPNADACLQAYAGTALEAGVDFGAGIQRWTVPLSGLWRIEAGGAQGASGDPEREGGRGARIVSEVELEAGDVLRVLVGHMGEASTEGSAGGGGASAVFLEADPPVPLVIAAGGGGVALGAARDGCPGRTALSGSAGSGANAGESFDCPARDDANSNPGGPLSAALTGAGGAGLDVTGAADEEGGGAGGQALAAGARGGGLLEPGETDPCGAAADGGFGGGGSGRGCPGAGGGGGWSGGAGGNVAGGGGSYSSTPPVEAEDGAVAGAGSITLTRVAP